MVKTNFGAVILYQLLSISIQFEGRCPTMKEKYYVSKAKCNNDPSNYHCLHEDSQRFKIFREECRDKKWVSAGYSPVFRGIYIDYEACPNTSYQPKRYWSNERYQCIYLRSTCFDEGQIKYAFGNTTSDLTCRCDTSKGYQFINPPANQINCNPAIADCSCFARLESVTSHTNKELACNNGKCSTDRLDIANESTINNSLPEYKRPELPFYGMKILVSFTILMTIIMGLCILCCDCYCCYEIEPPQRSVDRGEISNSRTTELGTSQNHSFPDRDDFEDRRKNYVATRETKTEENHLSTIVSHASQEIRKKDILILNVETRRDPILTFKKQLEKYLSDQANVGICDPQDFNTDKPIKLKDLLKKCDFVFVVIISDFSKETLTEYGYDGEDIVQNLNDRNVVTVSGPGITRRRKEEFRIRLDYDTISYMDFKSRIDLLWNDLLISI